MRPCRPRQSQEIDRRQTRKAHEHHIERMRASVDQPVELFGAVMDGMESPQQRVGMQGAVPPIRAEIIHEQHQEQL